MNKKEALEAISAALEKVLKQPTPITPETDLIEEGILDSLDGMVFLLEIESLTGKKFPDDIDLVKEGYYKIPKLLSLLGE